MAPVLRRLSLADRSAVRGRRHRGAAPGRLRGRRVWLDDVGPVEPLRAGRTRVASVTGAGRIRLEPELLERTLAEALATGGDLADIFAEDRRATALTVEDDRLDRLQATQDRGIGLRGVAGHG